MKNDPLVSVIIPFCNSEDWIEIAIESVLDHTYKNYEFIVIDDGSFDSTKAKLKKYIQNFGIKYFYRENSGPASERNLGINISRGKYIAFLDSDDLWSKFKLKE